MAESINKNIAIEDLVEILPESITYLMENGIRCLRCGEPAWGTLENAAKEKGFNDEKISVFVNELNSLLLKRNK
jgi:methionine synthase II (cobalamin-independent)